MPDLRSLAHTGDTVLIGFAIVLVIARQFRWRTLDRRGVLGLPLVVITAGLGYTVVGILTGAHRPAMVDALLVPGELVLVAATGAVMARATHLRHSPAEPSAERLQYRLTRAGLALWAAFVVVRIGSFVLAAQVGAQLPETTGAILVSFGVNRLVCGLLVLRRASGRPGQDPPGELVSAGPASSSISLTRRP